MTKAFVQGGNYPYRQPEAPVSRTDVHDLGEPEKFARVLFLVARVHV